MAKILQEIESQRRLIVEDYYQQSLLTNKYMARDFEATLRIQRNWRMHLINKIYIRKK